MLTARLIAIAVCLNCIAACTWKEVQQLVYESVRTRNQLHGPPAGQIEKNDVPDYLNYDQQRNERYKPVVTTPNQ